MRFALLTVTYSGLFHTGGALTLDQQIRRARSLGFDGLSIETKRPVASPLDLSAADRRRVRQVAADEGVTLCAVESMSNFASRFMEERENNLAMMRLVLDLAHDLGVDLVKVFAGWPGLINDEEEVASYGAFDRGNYFKPLYGPDLRRWRRAVEGIREVADRAADMGITLALQNHAPILSPGYEDALAMMREVDRPNVKLCLDVPLFYERQSDAYVAEAIERCGPQVVLTHYGAWNFLEGEGGESIQESAPSFGGEINYRAFVAGLHDVGYDGYLVSEYCVPCVRNHRVAGVDEIDKATRLGLQYMRSIVHETAPVAV